MNHNLESIGNLSREAFKKKTKEMAIIYAFEYLLSKKDAYSKLDRLNYNELKIQNYLMNGDLSFEEKLIIFKYRTRMADYNENYKSRNLGLPCPLCSDHIDSQFGATECPVIKQKLANDPNIDTNRTIDDIFTSEISKNSIRILKSIEEVRKDVKYQH